MVDNEVVGNAGYPRRKFARFDIAALLDGRYYLDKGLLEDIFGEIIVFDGVEYVRVDTILYRVSKMSNAWLLPSEYNTTNSSSDSFDKYFITAKKYGFSVVFSR